jgi:hypothetical protein
MIYGYYSSILFNGNYIQRETPVGTQSFHGVTGNISAMGEAGLSAPTQPTT